MCGIIGYTGENEALPILLDGLDALSYRGYDSTGVALDTQEGLCTVKSKGRLDMLKEKLKTIDVAKANCGIGHTRWATHGIPSDANAHPHQTAHLALVHNGIIENDRALRSFLEEQGYVFQSDTDTEAAACLIDSYYVACGDPVKSIFAAVKEMEGSFAFGILFDDHPHTLYAIRRDSPLIAAETPQGKLIASDVTAFVGAAKEYYRPEDDVLTILSPEGISFIDKNGTPVEVEKKEVLWDIHQAKRGGYAHFMHKEIHEEPEVILKTVQSVLRDGLPDLNFSPAEKKMLEKLRRIRMVACGTAMHAGLIGKNLIEQMAGINVEVNIASEFRYDRPIFDDNEMVILISQSGETADTLAALRYAKKHGIPTLSIVNVVGSTIAAESDHVIYTGAGPEIAVASTKAYMVQCAVLYVLAADLALRRGKMTENDSKAFLRVLSEKVPKAVEEVIAREEELLSCAKSIEKAENLFYIGRCVDWALCAEGSLKLKEISYIHSEAFAAGELKHGTISLITEATPVIAVMTSSRVFEKMISGIREVVARGAQVLAVVSPKAEKAAQNTACVTFSLPDIGEAFAPFPAATAMQLLAYHTARLRGNDVDKPRNLAKSVTVE